MEPKPTCIICGEQAMRRIEVPFVKGHLFNCENEECIRVSRIQLQGALRNQN